MRCYTRDGRSPLAMVVQNWIEIIQTANLSRDKEMDLVSRWLIITRAAVFYHDPDLGAHRRPAGSRLRHLCLDAVPARAAWPRPGACRQQHDQRLLRPQRRRRHGRVLPGPVRAASHPGGAHQQGGTAQRDPAGQSHRRRHRDLSRLGARLAGVAVRRPRACSSASSTSPRRFA